MSEPVRVLMINYKMHCAGIEAYIMNLYRNIDRSKVQFDFLVHYKEKQYYDDEITKLGGKIYRLSVRDDFNFIKYFKDLRRFFADHPEYRIVHGHMESFGVFYLRAAQQAGVPVRIAHVNIAQKNKGIKGHVKTFLNRSYGKYATDLFACSDDAGKLIFGDNSDFRIYNNVIDVEKFKYNKIVRNEVRKELGLENEFIIGHVGRFNTQKNHVFLIDVFAEVHRKNSNAVLLLVGEGNLEDRTKDRVTRLGLDNNVRFLGVRHDTNRLYQAMDLFLLPSLFEGLPLSGVEAQASGLKCVFSDAVTDQARLTNNVEFLPLSISEKKWAEELLKWHNNYKRINTVSEIKSVGYDAKEQAEQLKQFYLQRSAVPKG